MYSLSFEYNNSDIVYWVWLSLACGAGSSAPNELFKHFGRCAKTIYDAPPEEYAKINTLKKNTVAALNKKELSSSFSIIRWCVDNGVGMLPYDSEYFPESLRIISDAPMLLYYLGRIPDINRKLSIAVVGTRKSSNYGSRNTYTIAYDLASAGAVIVSGMALGVDGIAHRGALDADGYTIAVLGCGIDRVYPKAHANLMRELTMKGTVLTEFCPGTPPLSTNFPIRNRIISGLSQGTVVIEADLKSGSLITARRAKAQGRFVYALPGNVGALESLGTNKLIKDGERLVADAFDILEDYMESYASVLNAENIMNKLCKYRTDFNYKNVFRSNSLPSHPKLGYDNSSPGRVYTQNNVGSPHTPVAISVDEITYSASPSISANRRTSQESSRRDRKKASDTPSQSHESAENPASRLDGNKKLVYELLPTEGGISYDELIRSFPDRVALMMALTELEMDGLIASARGGYSRI